MGFLFKHPSRRTLDDLLASARCEESSDTVAMAEIIRRFEPLAVKIARTIDPPQHLLDDLINAARMGLVNAVRHHDGRPGFPVFAKSYMRGAALRELGRWVVADRTLANDLEYLHDRRADNNEVEAVEDRLAPWGADEVALAVDGLDADQRNIVDLRYRQDVATKDIAATVGTSGPAVSQRLATIHRRVALALAA